VAGEGKTSTAVSINEYKYTVNIGDQHIRITGMRNKIFYSVQMRNFYMPLIFNSEIQYLQYGVGD
jgi:hypothetical protein